MVETEMAVRATAQPKLIRRAGRVHRRGRTRFREAIEPFLHERRGEVIEVWKVQIDGRRGDTDLSRHAAQAEVSVLRLDDAQSSGEQLLPQPPAFTPPIWLAMLLCGSRDQDASSGIASDSPVEARDAVRTSDGPNRSTTAPATAHSTNAYAAYHAASWAAVT